jgi:hypothetical protein
MNGKMNYIVFKKRCEDIHDTPLEDVFILVDFFKHFTLFIGLFLKGEGFTKVLIVNPLWSFNEKLVDLISLFVNKLQTLFMT